MKFQNGCWLLREGFASFSPQQVYDSKVKEDEVVLCAPTAVVNGRGNTIDGVNLTIRVTTPMPEVIRVQTWHHKGRAKREPEFELAVARGKHLSVEETEETITIKSGSLGLIIGRKNWFMRYERDGELLTRSAPRDLAYIKEDWKGMAYDKGDGAYMRQQLGLSVGERIYGLGERFGAFVKNGQSVSVWNEDGGTSTEQSYKNIPFYLSNRGYGVFVNHPCLLYTTPSPPH